MNRDWMLLPNSMILLSNIRADFDQMMTQPFEELHVDDDYCNLVLPEFCRKKLKNDSMNN